MPQKKKEIKWKLHVPEAEHRKEFQQQVNEVYTDAVKYEVMGLKCDKSRKKKILIEILKKI